MSPFDFIPLNLATGGGLQGVNLPSPSGGDDSPIINPILATATSSSPKRFILQGGTYKAISAPFNWPGSPYSQLIGQGRDITTIQPAAGQQGLAFTTDILASACFMSDFAVIYSSDADGTNSGSQAFFYHVPGGTTGGFFNHRYERIHIKSAYRGFALADSDNQQTLWDSSWDTILFEHVNNRCVSMLPAVPVGIPNQKWFNTTVRNTGTPAIQSTDAAFRFNAVNEVAMIGGDWEGWTDTLVQMDGGAGVEMIGIHVEHHVANTAFCRILKVANGPLVLEDFTISGATTANCTGQCSVVHLDSGSLDVRAGWHNIDCTLGNPGIKDVIEGSSANAISVSSPFNFTKFGGNLIGIGAVGGNAAYEELIWGGRRQLAYAASMTPDLSFPSRRFYVPVTNASAFTFQNPTNTVADEKAEIEIEVQNTTGGAIAANPSFGTQYKLAGGAAFTNPGAGKNRNIIFRYDMPNQLWKEVSRITADL